MFVAGLLLRGLTDTVAGAAGGSSSISSSVRADRKDRRIARLAPWLSGGLTAAILAGGLELNWWAAAGIGVGIAVLLSVTRGFSDRQTDEQTIRRVVVAVVMTISTLLPAAAAVPLSAPLVHDWLTSLREPTVAAERTRVAELEGDIARFARTIAARWEPSPRIATLNSAHVQAQGALEQAKKDYEAEVGGTGLTGYQGNSTVAKNLWKIVEQKTELVEQAQERLGTAWKQSLKDHNDRRSVASGSLSAALAARKQLLDSIATRLAPDPRHSILLSSIVFLLAAAVFGVLSSFPLLGLRDRSRLEDLNQTLDELRARAQR